MLPCDASLSLLHLQTSYNIYMRLLTASVHISPSELHYTSSTCASPLVPHRTSAPNQNKAVSRSCMHPLHPCRHCIHYLALLRAEPSATL